MSHKKSFYITTTLPYVNADPHIGFALEIVRADVIARYKKLLGYDVFFNTGTDEYGVKILHKAQEEGVDPQVYVDKKAESFQKLIKTLNIFPEVHFTRTTDEREVEAAKEFWKRSFDNGDIEKKIYKTKYCVGCELEKTDSELEDGKCSIHPNLEIEEREEENYFFKFSKYQKKLLELYKSNPEFVVPDFRFNEIKSFVDRGLEDFSISRLKEKMPWGVEVPGDPEHVMYVWFAAFVNYISVLGWPEEVVEFKKFWQEGEVVQYAGKDNLRQQSAMWQAMLMSVGIKNSDKVVINGFITSGGQKMSKSLGNVVGPFEVVEKYGADTLRYFLCRELSNFEDSDFTWERFHEAYNANLVNGLGNLVSRVMRLAEDNLDESVDIKEKEDVNELLNILDKFEISKATDYVWKKIGDLDLLIQEKKPWESKDKEVITDMVTRLYSIARMLNPFMPETSEKIKEAIKSNKKPENLFPRIDA